MVIGAGPSGLLTMRHLKDVANVVTYEAKDKVGGVWVYSEYSELNHPNLHEDKYYKLYGTLHASLYEGLVSNLPKEVMTLRTSYTSLNTLISLNRGTLMSMNFSTSNDVRYMKDYAEHFNLFPSIKFNRLVTKVW